MLTDPKIFKQQDYEALFHEQIAKLRPAGQKDADADAGASAGGGSAESR